MGSGLVRAAGRELSTASLRANAGYAPTGRVPRCAACGRLRAGDSMEGTVKIEAIEVYHVSMPMLYPWRTAYGDDDHIESILVRMVSGEYHGWGEACPLAAPTYSPEWAGGAFVAVRDWLAPALVGQGISSGDQLQRLLSVYKGNQFAKASLDLAWWNLKARILGCPLWKVIGGGSDTVNVGADFGVMDSLDDLLGAISTAKQAGFDRVKLKYRPGWGLNMISAVRQAFPDMVFHIDCNSGYALTDLDMFLELDRFGLAMIEQPLGHDDLLDHAELQRRIQTSVCLDESISSLDDARQAIALEACRWINIKPGRVGGLTNAIAIHDLCDEAGVPCWVGGMMESAVGQSFNIALATLPNIRYPSDIFPSSRFYQEDLGRPQIELSGPSQVRASSEPGTGCEPDLERLRDQRKAMAVVT